MIFLPPMTSSKGPYLGESRRIATNMSRHHGLHREGAGAIDWSSPWSNTEWMNLLQRGSDKNSFQYCSDGLVIYPRSGVSGGSISVRNMACERGDESFRENAHKESLQCVL